MFTNPPQAVRKTALAQQLGEPGKEQRECLGDLRLYVILAVKSTPCLPCTATPTDSPPHENCAQKKRMSIREISKAAVTYLYEIPLCSSTGLQ